MLAHLSTHGWPAWIKLSCSMGGDITAANNDQPAAVTTPASAPASTARERCGWCCADFQRLWVHKGVCCQCEASLRQSGQCPTGAVANRSITSGSGVGATARGSRGAGTGSAGARNCSSSSSENTTVTTPANANAAPSAGASESGAAAGDRTAARAAARAAARLKAGHVASACPGSRAWCAHANRYALYVVDVVEAISDDKVYLYCAFSLRILPLVRLGILTLLVFRCQSYCGLCSTEYRIACLCDFLSCVRCAVCDSFGCFECRLLVKITILKFRWQSKLIICYIILETQARRHNAPRVSKLLFSVRLLYRWATAKTCGCSLPPLRLGPFFSTLTAPSPPPGAAALPWSARMFCMVVLHWGGNWVVGCS